MNPLATLFGIGVRLRNGLYARGILKTRRLTRPVVSVGNLSVGGSGKTPFVIMLGRALRERGIEIDVLSRGYGRQSTQILVVDPEGSPQQFGDEPLLIARKLGVPVVVGADRYQAGLLAESKFPQVRIHLLDDGFQHRRLHRDFDIVLITEQDLNESLLPAGRLREPFASLSRADAVVLPPGMDFHIPAKSIWRIRRQIHFLGLRDKLIAFCGIGHPEQFFNGLKKLGLELLETIEFSDHRQYTQRDIDDLLQEQKQAGALGFITTEKDATNLGNLARQLKTFETAELEIELEDAPQRISELIAVLAERCGCSV
jgi:tetraacyldisaccharide 4'-kinase